jgi:hypothetical protein
MEPGVPRMPTGPAFFDEQFVADLESNALLLSREFHELSQKLAKQLADITNNTREHLVVHKAGSEHLAEQVSKSVHSLHLLLTKCQTLNSEFQRVKVRLDSQFPFLSNVPYLCDPCVGAP